MEGGISASITCTFVPCLLKYVTEGQDGLRKKVMHRKEIAKLASSSYLLLIIL